MFFSPLQKPDLPACVLLAKALWPHETKTEIEKLLNKIMKSKDQVTFICKNDEGKLLAFGNISIRKDYVEASSGSPVGFLEGIYVKPGYRKLGIAKELVKLGEKWAKKQGCKEFVQTLTLKTFKA